MFLFWTVLISILVVLTLGDALLDRNREPTTKLVLWRLAAWISLALAFNALIWLGPIYAPELRHTKALEFLTGYIVEYSLSVDNLFVFVMLFAFFKADGKQELKALQWGIYGAMVLRLVFILAGVTLIHLFHPVIYFFGALLLWTSYKMLFSDSEEGDPQQMWLVRLARKLFPITKEYHGSRFFVRINGGLWATPMVLLVVAIESSDVMFAVDSIPAILSITQDPFIVFSSNIFAILGLRALFFLLARMMKLFRYLKAGVAAILAFVGIKMLLADLWHIPVAISLGVIAATMTIAVTASILNKEKPAK